MELDNGGNKIGSFKEGFYIGEKHKDRDLIFWDSVIIDINGDFSLISKYGNLTDYVLNFGFGDIL